MDGGNHFDGAGGYSGGGAQGNPTNGVNGLGGGVSNVRDEDGTGGAGYYRAGAGPAVTRLNSARIGGQMGSPITRLKQNEGILAWYKDICGSGGCSGAGGEIYYSNDNNIFAFNGDMITNGNYDTVYYEYDKDGNEIKGNELKVLEKQNGEKFIPTKIFAQSGVIRATYTTNQGSYTLDKVTRELEEGESLPQIAKEIDDVIIVKATNEILNNPKTGYTNPLTSELPNQGIGSGAGYLEASNGKFEPIT